MLALNYQFGDFSCHMRGTRSESQNESAELEIIVGSKVQIINFLMFAVRSCVSFRLILMGLMSTIMVTR